MRRLLMVFLYGGLLFEAYSQDEVVFEEILRHREEVNGKFKDKSLTPLNKKEVRKFKGLNYYPVDLTYRLKVRFVKNEDPVLFKMPTTTTRLPDYVKFGDVHFTINGQEHKLEVYQSPDIMKRPGYEDYLFIPFTDETNGDETYEVGRYLEMRIPVSGEDIFLDFNKSYNPYCCYSNRFSCPIPPRQNHLSVAIRAGEKKYRDEVH